MNFKYKTLVSALMIGLAGATSAYASQPETINKAEKQAVVTAVGKLLNDNYVYPEKGAALKKQIDAALANGDFANVKDVQAFATALTTELRKVNNDRHIRVNFDPNLVKEIRELEAQGDEDSMPSDYLEQLRMSNYGFKEIKILPGNIGYLKLNQFVNADLAGETAVAAMNYLANSDSLIIDLTDNGGGSPSMIQLLTSYLFGSESVLLNSFYFRPEDETRQTWTLPHVQGKKLEDTPVYVLTSRRTFSAAEEFSYNLKHLERATIVGETTGGGAHPGGTEVATDRFLVWIPTGRAINPITGTNWEGKGVVPHIDTPRDTALDVAYKNALKTLQEKDEDKKALYGWHIESLDSKLNPYQMSSKQLKKFVGQYGPRKLTLKDGSLYYQRGQGREFKLTPLSADKFIVDGLDYFRIQVVEEKGKITGVKGLYDNGQSDFNAKS